MTQLTTPERAAIAWRKSSAHSKAAEAWERAGAYNDDAAIMALAKLWEVAGASGTEEDWEDAEDAE